MLEAGLIGWEGGNVPDNMASAPGEQPSLPIILCILSVVKSVPSV